MRQFVLALGALIAIGSRFATAAEPPAVHLCVGSTSDVDLVKESIAQAIGSQAIQDDLERRQPDRPTGQLSSVDLEVAKPFIAPELM